MPPKKKPSKPKARPKVRKPSLPPPPPPADEVACRKASLAYEAGALGEATGLADRALMINPRRADALALLAACWSRRGDQARAVDYARRATETESGNPKWWNVLGWTHLQFRQFGEAKSAYLRAIATHPNETGGYYNLAKAEMQLGEVEAAADHLVQALTLNQSLLPWAVREFSSMASHPALAEWLMPPAETPKAKGRKKPRPKRKRR